MANGKDDIRVAVGWPRHPKTLQLIEEAGESAPYRLLALWCFAGENRQDGVMRSAAEVEIVTGWRGKKGKFHAALVSCGWLEQDGVTLHDWAIEQPWAAHKAERSASARASAKARWDAERMRTAMPDACETHAKRNAPSPSPSPSPSPNPSPLPLPDAEQAAAADPHPPEPGPDSLAARLARRTRWKAVETVASMLDELRAEGTPEAWLEARYASTPEARCLPYDWAKAARAARPKAGPATDQERIVAQRAAESHAKRYREHQAAGRTAQAASSWAQVASFAKDAGIDPETLRHDPMDSRGSAA